MPSRPEQGGDEPRIPPTARLVLLVGPTAVGKTAVALALAERFEGEILSLDSRQMVRGLDRGTAKPTAAERVRVAHHLVDVAEPDEAWPLSRVLRAARGAISEILGRGRLPILAGGTGQYVWAIAEGWRVPEVPPDPGLRAALTLLAEREGQAALHERLAAVDPASAARIDARNVRRVIRALEIHARTGLPKSEVAAKQGPPCPMLILGLTRPREQLYARIDARIDSMIAAGLEEEVRALVEEGCGFDLPAMSSLGYREWQPFFAGEIDRPEVLRRIRANTRRLVRTQGNWFAADDERITWIDLEEVTIDRLSDQVAVFLDEGTSTEGGPGALSATREPCPQTDHDDTTRHARFSERYATGRVPWDDPLPPPEIRALRDELEPGLALDLGCGYGRAAIHLARAGWRVDGVDFVAAAVAGGRERAAAAGVAARVRLLEGEVTDLSSLGLCGPYDLAIDVGCLHGLDAAELERMRDELRSVLRPGGLFLFFAHLRRPPGAAPSATDEGPRWLDEALFERLFAEGFLLEEIERGVTIAGDRGEVPSAWFRLRRT